MMTREHEGTAKNIHIVADDKKLRRHYSHCCTCQLDNTLLYNPLDEPD